MVELTENDLRILLFLVKNRLSYEARRKARFNQDGEDIQQKKVLELVDLRKKLEEITL